MASRFGQRRVGRHHEYSAFADSSLLHAKDRPSKPPVSEFSHSATWWDDGEEHREQEDALREQLTEMDEHVARLQDMLRCERDKCRHLQVRCNQQEAELRRREQHGNRLKERLSQLTDRHRDKGPCELLLKLINSCTTICCYVNLLLTCHFICTDPSRVNVAIEVLNFPPGGRGKREQPVKSLKSNVRQEEATLRLMLERREAELREAMKLRHSLTTVLHALRVNMEQSLLDSVDDQGKAQTDNKRLHQAESALGDHVTGGVVQSWRNVQRRLGNVLSKGLASAGTDHDKLLAQLETELKESQQLVQLQQQLLQDSLTSPVPSDLADCYFLEEWERLRFRRAELDHQRRNFERERQCFTDAAIRLSLEKASLLKQQYLWESPLPAKVAHCNNRSESTVLSFSGLGPTNISGCLPITPSPTESVTAAVLGSHQGKVWVQTPSTPELYSALNLSYNCRVGEGDHQSDSWHSGANGRGHTSQAAHLDWSF
ncbi:afadin- and alpha-actinin-binding protein isoform X1 [Genypterus blacodes]|uniref:afadin- and alpha-actinin-binding protein isoform X1 n=1 Tax=Genypterus blacodes TaxID=154954 RepID=UPI003F760FAE